MPGHPIRVVVEDDLRRSRLTVFFRLILAIPHLVWITLWSIAVFFIAIVSWFATLFTGRLPQGLHDFGAAYVRYWTHLYAYLYLAANPYPGFVGRPGSYPVDLQVAPPEPQSRWKTAFRLFLALPAVLLASTLTGAPGGGGSGRRTGAEEDWGTFAFGTVGVLLVVAFLGWFVCLVRGRMPEGFRDLVAYGLRYGAQTWGYLLLLTDRYPDADPAEPPALQPTLRRPIRLRVDDDLRRSRLTVFFRLLLFFPHYVWLSLWGIAAFFAAIASWFVTLARGRPPDALHRFLSAYVRYQVHVFAFLALVANPFPGFTGTAGSYPVDLEIDPPERQNRWVTGVRLVVALPAFLVAYALEFVLLLVGIYGWFVGLVLGRMPESVRNLGAYVVRYWAQTYGYAYLLTDRYPYSGPSEYREPEPEPEVVPV